MSTEQPETPPSDRLARALSLARRIVRYRLGAGVVFSLGLIATVFLVSRVKRNYMSECTFAVHSADKPGKESGETSLRRAARVKDMVYERGRLEGAIRKFNLYPTVVDDAGILDAVEAMKPHVGIRARESGRYVVSFDYVESKTYDARELVKDVTQYLADSIAEDFVGGSINELKSDADFLGKEVTVASGEIDTAVKSVTKFLTQHPEFATDLPQGTALGGVAKKPGTAPGEVVVPTSTDPVLAALYRQKARLEADLRASKTGTPPVVAPDLTRDKAVAAVDAAQKAYAVAQADVVEKSTKLTPEHPDMKSAQASAAAAAKLLQEARARLAAIDAQKPAPNDAPAPASSESESDKLKLIDAQIAARQAALKGAAPAATVDAGSASPSPESDIETEWQRALRALSEAKKRYDEVKSKAEATQLALKASEANKANLITIIEPAYRPVHPVKSKRFLTAVLGFASAVAFGLLYAIIRIFLEDQLADVGDVVALGLVPSLGQLPHIGPRDRTSKTDTLVKSAPTGNALAVGRKVADAAFDGRPLRAEAVMPSPTAPEILAVLGDDPKPVAALRLVRHRLEMLQAEGRKRFAITSAREREGKSTVAAQLALVLSESQRARVALVEASFHRPAIARLLGFEVPPGLGLSAQVVRAMRGGGEPWSMLALGPSIHVLAEAEDQPRFPRALHSAVFQDLLAMLAEVYDYVIIDAPCVLEGGEANALEPAVDGLIFVTRANVSKKSDLRVALRQLGTRKTLGVVLVGG